MQCILCCCRCWPDSAEIQCKNVLVFNAHLKVASCSHNHLGNNILCAIDQYKKCRNINCNLCRIQIAICVEIQIATSCVKNRQHLTILGCFRAHLDGKHSLATSLYLSTQCRRWTDRELKQIMCKQITACAQYLG